MEREPMTTTLILQHRPWLHSKYLSYTHSIALTLHHGNFILQQIRPLKKTYLNKYYNACYVILIELSILLVQSLSLPGDLLIRAYSPAYASTADFVASHCNLAGDLQQQQLWNFKYIELTLMYWYPLIF